jgi:hypothetical protein
MLDTYAHVTPGMQSEAAQIVADAVFGAEASDDCEPDGPEEDGE